MDGAGLGLPAMAQPFRLELARPGLRAGGQALALLPGCGCKWLAMRGLAAWGVLPSNTGRIAARNRPSWRLKQAVLRCGTACFTFLPAQPNARGGHGPGQQAARGSRAQSMAASSSRLAATFTTLRHEPRTAPRASMPSSMATRPSQYPLMLSTTKGLQW